MLCETVQKIKLKIQLFNKQKFSTFPQGNWKDPIYKVQIFKKLEDNGRITRNDLNVM